MAIQFNFVSSMLILLLLSISSAVGQGGGGGGGVIDVVAKFGAKADEKTYSPLLDAWKEACASTSPAKIVIPKWIYFLRCKNITFKHLTVSAPGESPNTDGIHIRRSDEVNVLNTEIKTGDDCVSIGDGSKNLVMNGVTCGPGHGINIGSLGLFKNEELVDGVTVKNCTLTNTSNGVRIKSWPGAEPNTCSNIHFENITVTNVSSPIIIDQKYCPWNKCKINVCTYLSKS
ncbi:hypothetical protein GOBAR_DD28885 [Gossypium barbadense]|nr:hypothetical protein GOBAR_DD28885 [Gossypium barbadense]